MTNRTFTPAEERLMEGDLGPDGQEFVAQVETRTGKEPALGNSDGLGRGITSIADSPDVTPEHAKRNQEILEEMRARHSEPGGPDGLAGLMALLGGIGLPDDGDDEFSDD